MSRKSKEEKQSSLIVSRVEREALAAAAAGRKIVTGNSIIRSRVHDRYETDRATADAEPKPTRKKATAKRTPRAKKSRHADQAPSPSTET